MDNQTDHESILLLRKDVQNISDKQTNGFNALSKSQENFHAEVRESFKRLEDNYSGRIDNLQVRVEGLEYKNNWFMGALAVIGICSTLVIYIYFNQQEVQNANIDRMINSQEHKIILNETGN